MDVCDSSGGINGRWRLVTNVKLEFLQLTASVLKMTGSELTMTAPVGGLEVTAIP